MAYVYNDDRGTYDWVEDEQTYTAPEPQPAPPFPGWVNPNGPNPGGTQDLAYWQSRGHMPEEMFNLDTGQLLPGWERTGRGYEMSQPAPTATLQYEPDYRGGVDRGGGGGGFQFPQRTPLGAINYPQLNLPRFQAPPAFSYEAFAAPSLEEAQSEPGFDYALKQGVKAFENSKAYTGTYRGGATLKGINDYAREMANQNYGQVFERKAQTYDRNRDNAADTYMTNYGVSRDVFDRDYSATKDEFGPKARGAELQAARDWDLWAYEGDDAYRRWKALIDANS